MPSKRVTFGKLAAWGVVLGVLVLAGPSHAAAQDPVPQGGSAWEEEEAAAKRPPTPEEEGFRSEVERAWFSRADGLSTSATRARATAFAMGIENLDPAARALIAPGDDANALTNAMLAVRLAPDLPLARMALAQAMWAEGDSMGALDQALAGLAAIFHNFEATAWLLGSLLVMIAAVMIVAPLAFIVSVAISVFQRASHDLGDFLTTHMPEFARGALLGCLLLLPLVLGEGVMGLVLSLFALGFVYGSSRHRMALALAVVFLLAGLYPVARTAATVLIALDSDPIATATMAVVQGIESEADVVLLEAASETEFLAKHILAVRARRLGRFEEAVARYAELRESNPRNAEVLTNYANLRFMSGQDEAAVDLYERSAQLVDSARVMFNLSQANARLFRIEEFEAALRSAQKLDAETVAELSRIGDSDFVADLGFPIAALRSRLLAAAKEQGTSQLAIGWLMPGWLGAHWMRLAGGFGLIALLGGIASSRFGRASSCTRCGKRICARCDGTVWNADTCDACHHLFHRPETTDPVLRMKRLYELQARDSRVGRLAVLVSLLVPGAAGLFARRPDLGFLGILSAGFAFVFFAWSGGVVPDPLAVGTAGRLAFLMAGGMAVFVYVMIVAAGLVMRRNL